MNRAQTFPGQDSLRSYQGSRSLLRGIDMQWRRNMKGKAASIIGVACLVGLGYLAGVQSVKADDPAASPVEVPQGWQRLGPYGGKVVDVAYAPSDPNIVYALLENRTVPVYKSTDNGKTWDFLSVPFELFRPADIVVSPVNPNIVIFCDISSALRSSDGGLTWSQNEDTDLKLVNFSKANPNKVYGTSGLLFRSMDSGSTWAVITNHYIEDFTLDPFNENRILATTNGTGFENRGLYESTDDGATWNLLGFEAESILSLEFGRTPGTIYLVKNAENQIWKSTDNGLTWVVFANAFASNIIDFDVTGQTMDEVWVTLTDMGSPYLTNIWRSINDGVTWQNLPIPWLSILYSNVIIDPSNSDHVIAYNLFSGMNSTWDLGMTWSLPDSVFPGNRIPHIGISAQQPGLILADRLDGSILRSNDSGQTWEYTNHHTSKGAGFAFSQTGSHVFFAAHDNLYRSSDGGVNWDDITPSYYPTPNCISTSSADDHLLLIGSYNGKIFRSCDDGNTWSTVYNADDSDIWINFIRFKPLDPTVVYAGTYNSNTSEVKLIKSADSGATWVEVSRLPSTYLRDLAVTLTEPEVIYVSDGQRLLRSKDFGMNWDMPGAYRSIDSDRCLTSFHHGSWVWSLGYIVFWFSGDYGETWRKVSMPSVYGESFGEEANMWMSDSSFFIATRYDGLWTHVDDMPPVIMMGGSNYNRESSSLDFTAWVTDVSGTADITTVDVLYEGDQTGLSLYDDGTHGDVTSGDGLFNLTIPLENSSSIMNLPYSMCAKDRSNLSSDRWPVITSE